MPRWLEEESRLKAAPAISGMPWSDSWASEAIPETGMPCRSAFRTTTNLCRHKHIPAMVDLSWLSFPDMGSEICRERKAAGLHLIACDDRNTHVPIGGRQSEVRGPIYL